MIWVEGGVPGPESIRDKRSEQKLSFWVVVNWWSGGYAMLERRFWGARPRERDCRPVAIFLAGGLEAGGGALDARASDCRCFLAGG